MDATGMGNLERGRSGGSEEACSFLDAEEWDKFALDWERRGQVTSRRTDRAFFRVLLWFILIGGGISVILALFPSLSPFEPIWRSPLPAHADDVALALFTVFLCVLAISDGRKYGKRASRVRVHGGLFEIVTKRRKMVVRIPAERVEKVEVWENAFSAGDCRMTLADADGRKYTIEHMSEGKRLGALVEFCHYNHVRYEQARESRIRAVLAYGIVAALFALWFAATNSDEWTTPVMVMAVLLLSRNIHIGEA